MTNPFTNTAHGSDDDGGFAQSFHFIQYDAGKFVDADMQREGFFWMAAEDAPSGGMPAPWYESTAIRRGNEIDIWRTDVLPPHVIPVRPRIMKVFVEDLGNNKLREFRFPWTFKADACFHPETGQQLLGMKNVRKSSNVHVLIEFVDEIDTNLPFVLGLKHGSRRYMAMNDPDNAKYGNQEMLPGISVVLQQTSLLAKEYTKDKHNANVTFPTWGTWIGHAVPQVDANGKPVFINFGRAGKQSAVQPFAYRVLPEGAPLETIEQLCLLARENMALNDRIARVIEENKDFSSVWDTAESIAEYFGAALAPQPEATGEQAFTPAEEDDDIPF